MFCVAIYYYALFIIQGEVPLILSSDREVTYAHFFRNFMVMFAI